MSKYAEFEWIKAVILSCVSVAQLIACSKLIFPFRTKYDTERDGLGDRLRVLQQDRIRIRSMWSREHRNWKVMLPLVKKRALEKIK